MQFLKFLYNTKLINFRAIEYLAQKKVVSPANFEYITGATMEEDEVKQIYNLD